MQFRYDSQAKERGVAIIGSCGFDSLVADLGVEAIRRQCERDRLDVTLIESFLSLKFGDTTVRNTLPVRSQRTLFHFQGRIDSLRYVGIGCLRVVSCQRAEGTASTVVSRETTVCETSHRQVIVPPERSNSESEC